MQIYVYLEQIYIFECKIIVIVIVFIFVKTDIVVEKKVKFIWFGKNAGKVDKYQITQHCCVPHTTTQETATTACTISLRSATVYETDQTSFTSRRETLKRL